MGAEAANGWILGWEPAVLYQAEANFTLARVSDDPARPQRPSARRCPHCHRCGSGPCPSGPASLLD